MGIERKVYEKWTCDNCRKEIKDKKEATIIEIIIRGQPGLLRKLYVVHNSEVNQWWQKSKKENLI